MRITFCSGCAALTAAAPGPGYGADTTFADRRAKAVENAANYASYRVNRAAVRELKRRWTSRKLYGEVIES